MFLMWRLASTLAFSCKYHKFKKTTNLFVFLAEKNVNILYFIYSIHISHQK